MALTGLQLPDGQVASTQYFKLKYLTSPFIPFVKGAFHIQLTVVAIPDSIPFLQGTQRTIALVQFLILYKMRYFLS